MIENLAIDKSSRHAKLTGDFGEALVLYWLSKYGFECARLDHTGIDIIARDPKAGRPMGISVKSRCRAKGKATECVNVRNPEFKKIAAACQAFGCEPYFAFVVDAEDKVRGYLLPLHRLRAKRKRVAAWKMTKKHLDECAEDAEVMSFEFTTRTLRWWKSAKRNRRLSQTERGVTCQHNMASPPRD